MKTYFFLTLIFTFIVQHNLTAQTQANEWLLIPEELSFSTLGYTSISTGLPIPPSYQGSNSIYDDSGQLLFYVTVEGSIFDGSGTSIGSIGAGGENPEVAICPVPGECSKYYVLRWERQPFIGVNLIGATVDVATSPITVTNFTNPVFESLLNDAVIAIDQPYYNNAAGDRWAYGLSDDGLNRFNVWGTGVFFGGNILSPQDFPKEFTSASFAAPEGELRGNCFAWGSYLENKAWVVVYDFNSLDVTQLIRFDLPEGTTVCGLEFNGEGTELYIAACGEAEARGIYRFDVKEEAEGEKLRSEEGEYYNTHIELGQDNFLYMASDVGLLGRVPLGGNVISPAPGNIQVNSFYALGPGFYTLPDQIDGENYDNFTGVALSTITAIQLNQQALFPTVTPQTPVPDFFDCQPMELEPITQDVNSFSLKIEKLGIGSSFMIETILITSTTPVNIDLFDLTTAFSLSGQTTGFTDPLSTPTDLAVETGDFRITLTTFNECVQKTVREGLFRISSGPVPSSILLEHQPALPFTGIPDNVAQSVNLGTPAPQGAATVGIDLQSSSGIIEYYRINYIREVDPSTGNVISMIYQDLANVQVNVQNDLDIFFNQVTFDPVTMSGYFNDPNNDVMDKVFQVDVAVGNVCGETTANSYFQIVGNFRPSSQPQVMDAHKGLTNTEGNQPSAHPVESPQRSKASSHLESYASVNSAIKIFPNPTQGKLNFSWNVPLGQTVTLTILDLSGKVLMQKKSEKMTGSELDISFLSQGIYLYRVEMPEVVHQGKVVKL
ncbi:MAG: T9SS type A sorting domain-containing protein [Bacteroidota bacterium]